MSLTPCPPPIEIERLPGGLGSGENVEAVEEHVLGCPACLARLKTRLQVRDTLVDMLAGDTATEEKPNRAVEMLMERIERLRPAGSGADSGGIPMISFTCDSCGKKLALAASLAGKKARCPVCRQVVPIPAQVSAGNGSPGSESGWKAAAAESSGGTPATLPSGSQAGTTAHYHREFSGNLTDFLAPPERPDEIGRLGNYRILKVLGHGGMGVVYQGEDIKLHRLVALKAMLPGLVESSSAGKRFLREARAMASVEHDHIVRIYQVDEDRGVPFLAMEFLKGQSLEDRLKRGQSLAVGEILRIGREIAEGLAAAHARGLIHRDIKPANIWLEHREISTSGPRVKILDFGLARAADGGSEITQQGAILGTPAYMAPEQTRGEAVDARCDLFSLGIVLYRMSTGHQPFTGKDTVSTLMAVATREPPAPIAVDPDLPAAFSDLVMKLLRKEIPDRVQTAREVVEEIARIEKEHCRQEKPVPKTAAGGSPASTLEGVGHGEKTLAPAGIQTMPGMAAVSVHTPVRVGKEEKAGSRWTKGRILVAAGCLAGLLAVALVMFGLIRFGGSQGEYVIETDDPDFSFRVSKGTVLLEDSREKRSYKLNAVETRAGEFELEVAEPGKNLVFHAKSFSIKRGEKAVLRAWFERKGPEAATGKTPDKTPGKSVGKENPPEPPAIEVGEVRRFLGHQAGISHVAFAPDGRSFLSGSTGEFWLWDVDGTVERYRFPDTQASITSGEFSRDGIRVIGPAQNGSVIVWERIGGERTGPTKFREVARFSLPTWVESVVPFPDGKRIYFSTPSGGRIHDLGKKAALPLRFLGARGSASQDGKRLLTFDGRVLYLWDPESGKELAGLEHPSSIFRHALSADGKRALAAVVNNVHVWDVGAKKELRVLKGPATVHGLAISPDGKRALTGGFDKKMRLWDLESGKEIHCFEGHRAPVSCVAFAPDGRQALSGGGDKTVRLWQLPLGGVSDTAAPPVRKRPWPDYTGPVQIEVKTSLGIQARIRVRRAQTPMEAVQQKASRHPPNCAKLALDLGKGGTLLIPFPIIREAKVENEVHVVNLIDGTTHRGRIVTTVLGEDNKQYDLSNAVRLTVVGAADAQPPEPKKALVSMRVPGSEVRTFLLYPPGLDTGKGATESFEMNLDGKVVQGNLTDFTRVRLEPKDGGWAMTVGLPAGGDRTGTLVMRNSWWWVVGEFPNGCLLVHSGHQMSQGFSLETTK